MTGFLILPLTAEQAAVGWEKALPLLEPAINWSRGLYEPDDVRDLIVKGNWLLWLLCEDETLLASWVTCLRYYPRGIVLEVPFAGGVGMERWYEAALRATDQHARDMGCIRIHCAGRPGWLKHGYRSAGHLFARDL